MMDRWHFPDAGAAAVNRGNGARAAAWRPWASDERL
jgi:hypothetical protein